MRLVIGAALALALSGNALAQTPRARPPAKPEAAKTYAAMPEAERKAIQTDLVWTGDYTGTVDGDFGPGSITAAKGYQKRIRAKETGVLTPQERTRLAADAKKAREAVGWRLIDDPQSGTRIGVPTRLAPHRTAIVSGSRFASARGEIRIETFRIAAPRTTLQSVFDAQRAADGNRKVAYSVMRDDFFVVSGFQGLQKVYVRAQARDGDVRGYSLHYDPATAGRVDPIAIAMSSAFEAFPVGVALAPPPRRKVEYGSGVFVSAEGHVVTSRDLIDECVTFSLTGYGPADLAAQDKETGLALLRIFGARNLKAAALAEAPGGYDITLIGVAEPSRQGGGSAVSTMAAKISPSARSPGPLIEPPPALGFAGAAAIDGTGKLVGIADVRTQAVAGPASSQALTVLIPAREIKAFLAAQKVSPAGNIDPGVDAAKAAVVRVICVRK